MRNRLKQFFNSMEEKYVFPIGRRTWQVLSFVGLITLLAGITWLIINMTPTSRDSVHISKEEVKNNVVDTVAIETVAASDCNQNDVKAYTDSIKKVTPMLEWTNLGSMEDETYYLEDEYGSYIWDNENYEYLTGTRKVFVPNSEAIPNIIQRTFDEAYIDSSDFCRKLSILKNSYHLLKLLSSSYVEERSFYGVNEILAIAVNVSEETLNSGIAIHGIINPNLKSISNKKEWKFLGDCVEFAMSNSISEGHLTKTQELILAHRVLPKIQSKMDPSDYLDLMEISANSEIYDEDDFENAVDDFIDDLAFYDDNKLVKSYKKYMNLYAEKLQRAINKQLDRQHEKSEQRMLGLMMSGVGFFSVVIIAMILLLFSIQNILKKREDKDS